MINHTTTDEELKELSTVADLVYGVSVADMAKELLALRNSKPIAWISSGEYAILSRLKKHAVVEVGLFNAQRFSDDIPLFTSAPIPTGWKIVPNEPTERMVIAGFESDPEESFSAAQDWQAYEAMSGCQQAAHKAKVCYAAMLAAAPEAPCLSASSS